jgi:hypothetical protein
MAREVAEQLMAEDPLAAQLETEYGIDEISSPGLRCWPASAPASRSPSAPGSR